LGRAPDVLLALHLHVLGIVVLIVKVRVERLRLSCPVQFLGQLPGLEDRLDLGGEAWISARNSASVSAASMKLRNFSRMR
jgi:hypothetical protein